MNRRDFLKGTAGLVIACGLGFGKTALSDALEDFCCVGPKLKAGLTLSATATGADVRQAGQLVFQVNRLGAQLLRMADGTHTLAEMAAALGNEYDTAMFFVTLGKAGYLHNRVEVSVYENIG
ncbi:MAG: twin-arginine translocation signal domain-containing protein [Clostridiales bacterium]|nr:twin-arginine translocation signal domain-containing protein [Clostridiales bacterium]